ncbi:HK97 gp10 family phage protein [Aureliella helgolandensis]|uniref:Uncharacterized protein n=1 Tax=Aureliella helgolandensis TaxID=2527968 RepID=A0A518GDR6_9BACT|nr:HK97 gp10 family phage protein [Aureliella helgolandensis]QDV26746.1 hypothetical protein Q31a_51250 [Aureliella helgolandensis]
MAAYVVTGSKTLNAKLASLKTTEAKKLIRKASRTALKPVQEEAKRLAPVKSGRLRRSIKVRALKRSRSRVGSRVTTNGNDNLFKGRIYYGGFAEYGWKAGRRATNADLGVSRQKRRTLLQRLQVEIHNSKRRAIPGRFFMKRAAKSKRSAALGIYRRELSAAIRKLTQAS